MSFSVLAGLLRLRLIFRFSPNVTSAVSTPAVTTFQLAIPQNSARYIYIKKKILFGSLAALPLPEPSLSEIISVCTYVKVIVAGSAVWDSCHVG